MTYVVDYSDGLLTGQQVKGAGYAGSIRYVPYDNSGNHKFATVSEVRSQIDAGLGVALIKERDTFDAQEGYAGGQRAANYIVNFAVAAGMQKRGYVAQDAWLGAVTADQINQYVQGAASVLGYSNTGIYGFYDTQNATANLQVGARWLCGSASNINASTSVWQDNNFSSSIAGIRIDRNLICKSDWLQTSNNNVIKQGDNNMQLVYCDEIKSMGILDGGMFTGDVDGSVNQGNPASMFPRLFVSLTIWNALIAKSHMLEGIVAAVNANKASTDAIAAALPHTSAAGSLSISGTLNVQ